MKGVGNENVDRGSWFDVLLRNVGGWFTRWAERRFTARLAAKVLPPGTRIRVTGKCCTEGRKRVGECGVIDSYVEDADDYRVHFLEDAEHRENVEKYKRIGCIACAYMCANGFEVIA